MATQSGDQKAKALRCAMWLVFLGALTYLAKMLVYLLTPDMQEKSTIVDMHNPENWNRRTRWGRPVGIHKEEQPGDKERYEQLKSDYENEFKIAILAIIILTGCTTVFCCVGWCSACCIMCSRDRADEDVTEHRVTVVYTQPTAYSAVPQQTVPQQSKGSGYAVVTKTPTVTRNSIRRSSQANSELIVIGQPVKLV